MPLKIFQMARSMYVQLRDGKPHSNQAREQNILKMESEQPQGSLQFNASLVQGGHLTYFLSGLACKKVTLLLLFLLLIKDVT